MEDRKRIGRIVRRRDKPVILAILQDRRIAVADEDLRMDVFGEQRVPAYLGVGALDFIAEDVRHARAEVMGKLAEELGEVLLRAGGHGIVLGNAVRSANADDEPVALLGSIDVKRKHGSK